MFCYQCEQTTRSKTGSGCATAKGVCGKDSTTADLQDLLVYAIKGIAQYAKRTRALMESTSYTSSNAKFAKRARLLDINREADGFILFGLFTTLTNVNFTASRFVSLIQEAAQLRDRVKAAYESATQAQGLTPELLSGAASWVPASTQAELLAQAKWGAITKQPPAKARWV